MIFFRRQWGQKVSRITRADQARDAGDWDLAARLYREALDRNPQRGSIWIQYGHVLKEAGRLAEAEAAYRRAMSCDPADSEPHLHLGHVLKQRGKAGDAQTCYLRAFVRNPSRSDPLLELSRLGWPQAAVAELQSHADAQLGRRSD